MIVYSNLVTVSFYVDFMYMSTIEKKKAKSDVSAPVVFFRSDFVA